MQVSSASSAQALEMASRMRERMFSRADQDSSGGLSLDEFRAMRPGNSGTQAADSAGGTTATDRSAEIFSRLDTDGDGTVSAEELEAGRPARPAGGAFSAGSMAALLSGQEASETSGTDDFFASLDTDGDGSLSAAEFAAGRPPGGPRGAGGPPPDGPPPGATDEASETSQADTLSELVRKALESYLQATTATAQNQTSTLASA